MKQKVRDSNFELLRIIAMVLIVMHHLAVHGGSVVTEGSAFLNVAFLRFFELGGKLAVNVFVLISGYFLVKSKFKPEKLVSLIAQIFIYSTIIYLAFVSAGITQFNWKEMLYAFFPCSTNAYWFMSCYVLMYIFSPFVNIILKHISQKQHIVLILVLFLVCSVLPVAFDVWLLSTTSWFFTLYITAAYIALYPKLFERKWIFTAIFIVSYLVIVLLKILKGWSLHAMDNPLCYICSVGMFVMFKNVKIKYNPVINVISSTTLGVYLIHDNNYVRPFLWREVLKVGEVFKTGDFWWKAILFVIVVYITCTVIEWVRQILFKGLDKFVHYNIFGRNKGIFLN